MKPRGTFAATQQLLLVVAAVLAVYISVSTYAAPRFDDFYQGANPALEASKAANVPAWTTADAAAFPHCVDKAAPVQRTGGFLVVRLDGSTVRMDYDRALTVTHDANSANDVWVIGTCS